MSLLQPIPFALVPIVLLCCDPVVVRKMVRKINQTKSQVLFSNQSSDGHWEHAFTYFDIQTVTIGLLSSDIDIGKMEIKDCNDSMRLAA